MSAKTDEKRCPRCGRAGDVGYAVNCTTSGCPFLDMAARAAWIEAASFTQQKEEEKEEDRT